MNNDYTTYDALELAGDAWFIQWIVEGDPEAQRFWETWQAAHPEKQAVLKEARKIVSAIHFKEEPTSPDKIKSIWQNIDTIIEKDIPSQPAKRSPVLRWIAYAAAAASVAIVFFFILNKPETRIMANKAEQMQYYLPDSSLVQLNAASAIVFNAKKWKENRTIQLDGEAYFEVKKGSTFTVETARGSVEVLGTSFNVNTHDGRFEVACFTGKVKVDAVGQLGQQANILTPGKKVSLDRVSQIMQADTFNLSRKNWYEGNIEFQTALLEDVFSEMERQFDISIEIEEEAILKEVYTGFLIRENLDSTLTVVCWPKELRWEKKGTNVVVIGYQ